MTRGGALKSRTGPERRCIASGESGSPDRMIRFARSPAGEVVPDLAGRLPGRGAWVTADRALVERAVAKRLFSRAFRAQSRAPEDLADRLEAMLAQRLVDVIGLARKAGQAVAGFEKVRARLRGGRKGRPGEHAVGALLEAADGAADGREKLARLAGGIPVIAVLTGRELGLAFGRDFAIHAALDRGGFADRAITEALRLEGLRAVASNGAPERRAAAVGNARHEGPAAGPGQGDG